MHTFEKITVPEEAARRLLNQQVLIVGGDCREEQLRRLETAFPSTKFLWRTTKQSDASLDAFERQINRANVAMVIVIYGLSRTSHSKGARRLCSQAHKPLLWCRRPTVAALVRAILSSRSAAAGLRSSVVKQQIGGEK